MLKKITKDLPLHPIPLALKWDHISDLKLAYPEFRTLARIDLLLGAEIFASILRDGRRTGPRGTPSAINTYLGWVLFGKIQDSDVVDVANYTLEQDELKYLTGSGRSYAAVLTADKKMTSAAPDGGLDEWLRDHHSIRDVNLITMSVKLPDEGLAKQDLAICKEKRTYAGGTLGKQSGFGRRYVGAISPLINFEVVCLVVISAHPVNIANWLYM